MIPRSRVDVVRADEPIADVLTRMSTGHTRYPVVGTSTDDLLGVVHLHDLLADARTGTALEHARPASIVPTTLPLPTVLQQLNAADDEMALVVDEYGGFAGVVTVEDMAEELVGEIADEHDPVDEVTEVTVVDGGWLIPGGVHVDEVARVLDEDLPEHEDYETFAGLVIAEFGNLPQVGDVVDVALAPDPHDLVADEPGPIRTLRVEVREVDKHVPSLLHVSVESKDADDE